MSTLKLRIWSIWSIAAAVLLAVMLLSSSGCREQVRDDGFQIPEPIDFDLDSIKERGKLVLITENSATTYYQYRGSNRGFDYEMVRAFAKHIGVKLELRILDDVNQMFTLLNTGEGDLIASNLAILPERKEYAAFSDPLYSTRQILVQRMPGQDSTAMASFIKDSTQLDRKPIWVHRYSSFYQNLKQIEQKTGKSLDIREAPGKMSTEDLVRLTDQGELEATITDENLSAIIRADYPALDMSLPVTPPQEIGWAMRSNASGLIAAVNAWLKEEKTEKLLKRTYRKYFGNEQESLSYRGTFSLPNISGSQISVYDSLFRLYAPEIGWDWKMLAALVFQESRFNPHARSWSGAFGLMQMMPETAVRFGSDTGDVEEGNIRAGVKYIRYLDRMWRDKVPNKDERVKFVLASYNIGPGHVMDAQVIARSLGKADTLWEQNVGDCLLLKTQAEYYMMEGVRHGYCRAQEPFHFVRKILAVYDYYKTLAIP